MAEPDESALHDFPDRIIGRLQALPPHLRELVAAVAPQLADQLDFARAQPVRTKMEMPDWRKLDSDLLFEVPFKDPAKAAALVCVLVEHQSQADPAMPLRSLLYSVFYWERQWRKWEAGHPEGEPLRLNPVLPIVLHTGPRPWHTHRTLADLFGEAGDVAAYQPKWEPLFWDVAAFDVGELLKLPGEWLPALAVARVERQAAQQFEEVFLDLLRRLEPLGEQEKARWQQLVEFVILWSVRRRPKEERQHLYTEGLKQYKNAAFLQEIQAMAEAEVKTWEEELTEIVRSRTERETTLRNTREHLQLLLEKQFGTLPQEWVNRIEQVNDVPRLKAALVQVLHLKQLDDLQL